MSVRFTDRRDAGARLAETLAAYKGRPDAVVLALPRGGAAVGAEIAKDLDLPMDLMLVRKLGAPGEEELAMGALAAGGVCFLNEDVIAHMGVRQGALERVIAREKEELKRRNDAYRGGRPAPEVKGKTVILVDDGVATGADMHAAVRAAKQLGAAKVVVAVPVCPDSAYASLEKEADEVISLAVPAFFYGVGSFYDDFRQMEDEEVVALMGGVRQ